MPDDFWKARAFDEMAAIATSGQDTSLAQTSSGKALQIAAKLTGDDKQNWENHLSAQFPLGAQVAGGGTKQVDKYAKFVESELKDQLYADFSGYMRGIEAKSERYEVLSGTLRAAEDISEKLKKLQNLETSQPKT